MCGEKVRMAFADEFTDRPILQKFHGDLRMVYPGFGMR